MAYQFDFVPVLANTDLLLRGALFTLELTGDRRNPGGGPGHRRRSGAGVENPAVRLVLRGVCRVDPQHAISGAVVFIFFGLPSLGLKITEWQAAVLAMVINLGAYSTEIIRAGIQAIPGGQLEAAAALAMTRFEAFRHVVLLPALGKVWPALSSQIIIVMLGSAVCSQIATEELSFAANFIQSRNFRAFETYALTTLVYLCMALMIRQLLNWIGRRFVMRNSR